MKKNLAIILSVLMVMSCFTLYSCSKKNDNTETDSKTNVNDSVVDTDAKSENESATESESKIEAEVKLPEEPIKVYTLKGPTGMGMAKLISDTDSSNSETPKYDFTIASSPDEVTAEIIKGNYDIAALPTNLAAVLYTKTEGKIRIAAVNTLGVLYILENGDEIKSIEDISGKDIYATGQGSTPEYVLNYILEANNIDCNVTYLADHSELASLMMSGEVKLGLLPVPNATTVIASGAAHAALNMTEEWEKAAEKNGDSSALYMGCIIINPDFIENYPDAVEKFLTEYAESVEYVNKNIDEAADMIEACGIIPKAAVAKLAIPDANIVCITGEEMAEGLIGFYDVLFKFNPKSVGGSLPENDIFYINEQK